MKAAALLLTRQNVEKQENFFLLLHIFYFRRQVLEGCYLIFIWADRVAYPLVWTWPMYLKTKQNQKKIGLFVCSLRFFFSFLSPKEKYNSFVY